MADKTGTSEGLGISTLTLALIILKLIGVIDWPWLWVFSPMWIGALAALGLLTLVLSRRRRPARRTRRRRSRR